MEVVPAAPEATIQLGHVPGMVVVGRGGRGPVEFRVRDKIRKEAEGFIALQDIDSRIFQKKARDKISLHWKGFSAALRISNSMALVEAEDTLAMVLLEIFKGRGGI